MDESLARCAIDFCGRKALILDLNLNECNIEDVAVEDIIHFFNSFTENAKMNLHLHVLYGKDQHHKIEAAFKALAKAMLELLKDNELQNTRGIKGNKFVKENYSWSKYVDRLVSIYQVNSEHQL